MGKAWPYRLDCRPALIDKGDGLPEGLDRPLGGDVSLRLLELANDRVEIYITTFRILNGEIMLRLRAKVVSGFIGGSMKSQDSPRRFTCPKCGSAEIVWNGSRKRCPNVRCNAAFSTLRARHRELIRENMRLEKHTRAQKDAMKSTLNWEFPPVRISREVKIILEDFCAWNKKNGNSRNKQQEIISDAVLEFIQRSGFKIPK